MVFLGLPLGFGAERRAPRGGEIWNGTRSSQDDVRFGQRDALTDVSFSPDGTVLATAGWDQSVTLFPWQTEDLIASACQRFQRNFRYDEW